MESEKFSNLIFYSNTFHNFLKSEKLKITIKEDFNIWIGIIYKKIIFVKLLLSKKLFLADSRFLMVITDLVYIISL